jgi:long-chain acyl-CoA synthetase
LDADHHDVPAGTPGEIFARLDDYGDFTYHEDPNKRAAAEIEGLVSVGDIGCVDDEGYLFLKDRKTDVVIRGGVNIYPAEIESALASLAGVRDSAVFGIPDESFGEALAALIESEPGALLSEDDVRAHLSERIAHYKLPKIIEFRESLPREDTGKILKRRLREPFWVATGRSI